MNALDPTIIAPLVRGLFLDALGLPVIVSSVLTEECNAEMVADLTMEADFSGTAAPDEEALALTLRGGLASAVDGSLKNWMEGKRRVTVGVSSGQSTSLFSVMAAGVSAPGAGLAGNQVLEGRVALVTGGAQGLGEEISRGLAAAGAYVFIADLNHAGAVALAAALRASPCCAGAAAIGVNVADEDSVAAMFDAVAAASGGLDLIVSNAGVLRAGSVLEQDEASFRSVTDINYTAFFFISKHGGRLLRRQRRTAPSWMTDIIQINSKSGLQGSNRNGAYAGSKFGSIGLVQSYALELVHYGIKVNAICPGNFFDGPLWSHPEKGLFVQYLAEGKVPGAKTIADVRAFYESKVPMGRGVEGADVMRALRYLVEQAYETGQALPVTGGQVMLN